MNTDSDLNLFAEQLCTWAQQIIENGRTPFRRVDLFHPLQTSAGTSSPPLTFWINRQSMIAGGLIFLPEASSGSDLSKEAATAAALGLQHFVTWETEQINVWEVSNGTNHLCASLPLATTDDPATFHHRLYELIDQLKLLSVTGRIDAEEISPFYLLNLLEETLALARPALIEHCRQRQGDACTTLPADEEVDNWNRLTMLRLLSLLHWDLLPTNLPLEDLLATCDPLLSRLPSPLGETLRSLVPGVMTPLPNESAVAYHHLLLRLQQTGWQGRGSRGEETLHLLLERWYGQAPTAAKDAHPGRLLLHSEELAPPCNHEVSHSGAQLAANALFRTLSRGAHPTQHQGNCFRFNSQPVELAIHANFYGDRRPDSALRRELSGHLRTSWPNRNLTIPGNLPFWVSEATHLLGLSAPFSQIELHLPSNWLQLLSGTVFCELLFTNFVIEAIDCQHDQRHLLRLQRQQGEILTDCLLLDGSHRSIELGQGFQQASSRLFYTLELPEPLFDLLSEQQLLPLTTAGAEAAHPEALLQYSRSDIGGQLWQMRSQTAPPLATVELVQQGAQLDWLVPEALHLRELDQLAPPATLSNGSKPLNDLLAKLLALPSELSIHPAHNRPQHSTGTKPIGRSLIDKLLRQLEAEGVPQFPQTYLYRQATGLLDHYHFTPPLQLRQEFLGQYELEDAQGEQFQVSGEETKEAMMLASLMELTELEIPHDRQLAAEMLDSYRQDLAALHEKIVRLCHRHIDQPAAAQRLLKKLWQQLPLPPLKWLSS